jgi:hypothetical protein
VAEYVEEAAEKIRHGSFRELVDNATDFAKHRPAAFLGITVLAGFAAVRFLKASGPSSSSLAGTGKRTSSHTDGDWNRTTTPAQAGESSRGGFPSEPGLGGSTNRGSS